MNFLYAVSGLVKQLNTLEEIRGVIKDKFSYHSSVTSELRRSYTQKQFIKCLAKMIARHPGLVFQYDEVIRPSIPTEEIFVGDEEMIAGFFQRRTVDKQLVFVLYHIIINETDTTFYGTYVSANDVNSAYRKFTVDEILPTL